MDEESNYAFFFFYVKLVKLGSVTFDEIAFVRIDEVSNSLVVRLSDSMEIIQKGFMKCI